MNLFVKSNVKSVFIRKLCYSFLAISLFNSCSETKDLSVVNLSNLYRSEERYYNPEFLVRILSDTTASLSTKISNKLFLFSRQSDDRFGASVTIRYSLSEAYESIRTVLDSGSSFFKIDEAAKDLTKVYDVPFRLSKKSELLLVVTIHDNQKNFEEEYYVPVDNSSPDSRQSFSVYQKGEKKINYNIN